MPRDSKTLRIALLLDNYPAISETFIDNQILSLLDRSIDVTILSFGRGVPDASRLHGATRRILEAARLIRIGVPRPRAGRAFDLLYLLAHPIATLRILLRALGAGALPSPYDFIRLVMAAVDLGSQPLGFDHVFCHFAPNGQFGTWLADLGLIRGRLVTFFHGYDFSERVQAQGPDIYRRLFKRGDLFVANTNYTRRRILEIGAPEARTVRVPVGLYPDRFPFRARSGAGGRAVRFLSIGRLVEKKGHVYAIEALALVRAAGVDASLAIIGEGPTRPALEAAIARLDLGGHVELLGRRTQEDVARLADAADIFVLASTSAPSGDVEGQGLVLQEAQALGMPVIASNHNGFPEGLVDGETGVLVPERDPPALAEAMIELARRPERWTPMGSAGSAWVRRHFDQAYLTEQLLILLGEVPHATAEHA
ncbi:colanic acid biosynthesis glycosyltransferase WcaL [Aliidongia dinghuensis]|uniref:Colanic acid biosynthesis glycosyltransferase WcaL n=1 Tax=Aliidongia dinghuensis TaxID=1867774 RepID=A0A8J3E1E2_9PROT|nr:glycosyltransferase [Aliidongia dinghuensis]GGE99176.1 colanic acid biosynthesis glycosyltransferase WcaL [Aliidongia dinghuensis]